MCGAPKDVSLNLPRLTAEGNKDLYIENYGALISFAPDEITVGGRKILVSVSGKSLEIKSLRRDDILITGEILHIEYKIK